MGGDHAAFQSTDSCAGLPVLDLYADCVKVTGIEPEQGSRPAARRVFNPLFGDQAFLHELGRDSRDRALGHAGTSRDIRPRELTEAAHKLKNNGAVHAPDLLGR